jgi:plastocyanin
VRAALLTMLLPAGLLAVGCTGGQLVAQPVETTLVTMAKSYRFEPPVIRVPVGATVTWTNDDNFTHDVHLLRPVEWHSQPLRPGERTTYTFAQPGEYAYECAFHPQNMKGRVIVE